MLFAVRHNSPKIRCSRKQMKYTFLEFYNMIPEASGAMPRPPEASRTTPSAVMPDSRRASNQIMMVGMTDTALTAYVWPRSSYVPQLVLRLLSPLPRFGTMRVPHLASLERQFRGRIRWRMLLCGKEREKRKYRRKIEPSTTWNGVIFVRIHQRIIRFNLESLSRRNYLKIRFSKRRKIFSWNFVTWYSSGGYPKWAERRRNSTGEFNECVQLKITCENINIDGKSSRLGIEKYSSLSIG